VHVAGGACFGDAQPGPLKKLTWVGTRWLDCRETREKDFIRFLTSTQMAQQNYYYSMSADGRMMIFDYRQYLGEHLYALVKTNLAETEAYMKEVGFWHEAATPERIVGMIMAAGYTVAELIEMIGDENWRGEIVVEAVDLILEEDKKGTVFPVRTKQHPAQRTPVWQTLSAEGTKAVLTMRPLFPQTA
jgi:hypothetical protein